jgi:hypothetical protein
MAWRGTRANLCGRVSCDTHRVMTALSKLVVLSQAIETSAPLGAWKADGPRHKELHKLLVQRNGFYCFESALHVLPSGGVAMPLEEWNAAELWRNAYDDMAEGCFFLAEDALAINSRCVETRSSPSTPTGDLEVFAATIEEWAERTLDDDDDVTGYPLVHKWQELHGPLGAIPGIHRGPQSRRSGRRQSDTGKRGVNAVQLSVGSRFRQRLRGCPATCWKSNAKNEASVSTVRCGRGGPRRSRRRRSR